MFQEKYEFEELKNFLLNEVDLVFLGRRNEERCLYFKNNFTGFKGDYVYLEADSACDRLKAEITDAQGQKKGSMDHVLLQGIPRVLKDLDIPQKRILIDFTGMQQGVLFLLINRLICDINPKLLFCAYTEPLEYVREDPTFSLSDSISDFRPLPGFARRERDANKKLVALLGFERHRGLALLEHLQTRPKEVITILGFPAYMPGWKCTALSANDRFLSGFDCLGKIYLCEAASPYRLYQLLKVLSDQMDGQEFLLAPLGTRPHALGAALFASLNKNCTVIYDFPVEKEVRSNGILKTNIYHLSKFITPKYEP